MSDLRGKFPLSDDMKTVILGTYRLHELAMEVSPTIKEIDAVLDRLAIARRSLTDDEAHDAEMFSAFLNLVMDARQAPEKT